MTKALKSPLSPCFSSIETLNYSFTIFVVAFKLLHFVIPSLDYWTSRSCSLIGASSKTTMT